MKKKFKRIMVLLCAILVFLTGCSVSDEQKDVEQNNQHITHLNLQQADLISQVTDNVKYLNPDLLYDIEGLDDDDEISIIVTMSNEGLADDYFENSLGFESVSDYTKSSVAKIDANQMLKEQKELANKLVNKGLIFSSKHSYVTLFNGFSATTTFANYKKLVKMGIAEKVSISEVYAAPQATSSTGYTAVENLVDVYETGIFNSSSVEYDGENTAVAILDSGFDIHHTVFQNMPQHPMITKEDVSKVLNTTKASTFTSGMKVEDVYVNAKIPYAYDYADKDPDVAPFDSEHGTHVAGIIGGKDDVITGVAINTQLVLMKVFGDLVTGAKEEDILAALEDSVTLGVDAINMSLGFSCGFSYLEDNDYLNSVYNKIEEAGISLIVAASNDYSSAYGGEESNTSKVTNPDSATVGSPSTYYAALSVASISGEKSRYIKANDGYVFYFNEANNASALPYDFVGMLNLPENKDVTYDYVTVPGYGKKINYSNIDVNGKVALVKRGDINFEEKARIAYEEGAVACIVYNNIGGDILMSAGNDLKIPLCSISKDDGEYLASKNTGTLTFNSTFLAGPFMSDFSSWGPNPDLTLKPEITAHGGNIKSSIPGGGYDKLSGTSMACPNMCGIIVLIRQYVKEKFPQLSTPEMARLTNNLLMSSATIALDQAGNPYSPRKQGAGLASLFNAVNTNAYLTVDGSDRAKIELGDDPNKLGVYTLKFTINNVSDKPLSYDLTNYTMTESVSTSDPRYVAEKSYMLNPATSFNVTGDGTKNGNTITINANGKVNVEYTLTLNESEKRYIRTSFPNGMYVEGFAKLISKNEDKIDLSIPFLAFFGDWTSAPMFDKTFYEVEAEAHDASINDEDKLKADYYATTPLGTYYYNYIIPLGSYVYVMDETMYDPIPATEEHAALGYNDDSINGITTIYAGLLRNAKKMTTTIKNTLTGEVVYEHVNYNQFKAHYSGGQIPSYDLIYLTIQELGLANNTNYTLTMQAELPYGDGGLANNQRNTFSFTFYVDFEAPTLYDTEYRVEYDRTLEKNRYYLDVYVYDNHYAMSVRPFTLVDGALVSLCENPTPIYSEKGAVSKATLEITDYMDLLHYGSGGEGEDGLTNGLGIMVDDYAMNSNYYYVSFPGTDSENFYFEKDGETVTEITTHVGEEVDLGLMMSSDDEELNEVLNNLNDRTKPYQDEIKSKFMSTLNWKSSNPSVVQVFNGKIEGIAPGRATITATNVTNSGYIFTKSLSVIVEEATPSSISKVSYKNNSSRIMPMAFNNNVSLKDIKFTYYDTIAAFIDGPEYSEIGDTGDRNFFTDSSTISFYPSEKVKLAYEITPWNLDPSRYQLTWSSSNPSVATVDNTGLVTAIKEGTSYITLRIAVKNPTTGNFETSPLLARATVVVKNEFIVEGRILTAYKGNGGDVVIPDDLGIMYIGSYAFSLYTTDMSIKVDENDWDANKTAGGNTSIKSVTIPYDVTEVQKYAFYNCPELEKVTFLKSPDDKSCKIIREYAFMNDTKLSNINLEKVQVIGANAFKNCVGLKTVDFTNIYALGEEAFSGCTGLQSVDISTLRNAWPNVFKDCTNLTSFTSSEFTNFSEGMFTNTGLQDITIYSDRIPASTFANCPNLENVTIQNNIIYIGDNAFEGDRKLNTVTFNGTCDYIYQYAFKDCTGMTSLILPNSPISFEMYALLGCSQLSQLKFQENTYILENMGVLLEACRSLTTFEVDAKNQHYKANNELLLDATGKIIILAAPGFNYNNYTIPSDYDTIGEGAFSGISTLRTLKFAGNPVISPYAFAECTSLTTVTLPTNITSIGEGAFEACVALRNISNLKNVKEIGGLAFASTALVTIEIGDDTNVLDGAFSQITTLRAATFGKNVTLGEGAFFADTALATVNINADGMLHINGYCFANCVRLATIDLSLATGEIGDYAFYNCQSLRVAHLTNITKIGEFAFSDCVSLSTVTIPMVESIGDAAFGAGSADSTSGTAIASITLPNTLKTLGEAVFFGCPNLTSVTIPSSIEDMKGFVFANCSSLETVILEDGITYIPEYTFYMDQSLITVTGGNILEVADSGFYGCLYLESIDLTHAQTIGMDAFYSCQSLVEVDLQEATYLADGAFFAATDVTTLNIPKVEYIGQQALSNIGVRSIVIPNTIKYIAPTAFYANENQTSFIVMINGMALETGIINDYASLYNSGLYITTENGGKTLIAYPTGRTDIEYVVEEGTERIEIYAGADNLYLQKIILPETLQSIGNMAFYGCTHLETVEFRSTVAPILEGVPYGSQSDYTYPEDSKVYELLTKYYAFNGTYPYYYGQFKAVVGTISPLKIIVPSNFDTSGFESIEGKYSPSSKDMTGFNQLMYAMYFDLENMEVSTRISKNATTMAYLRNVSLIPNIEDIQITDEKIIRDAVTAYNALNQNLLDFGYTQQQLNEMHNKMLRAQDKVKELKLARVNEKYADLVKEIEELGTVFSLDKYDLYKKIVVELDYISKSDQADMDLSNVDAFKLSYQAYFKNLNQEVSNMTLISNQTTSQIIGAVATSVALATSVIGVAFIIKKHWF